MKWALLFSLLLSMLTLDAAAASAEPFKQAAEPLPGVALAEGISQITGVAISPLLGVSTVGAWRYLRAPAELRAGLPWFCQPGFWGAGLALMTICFLKDLFGTAAPPLLKKPLDLLELFENKLSAVVACAAFVPLVVSQFSPHPASPEAFVHGSQLPVAMISLDVRLLTVPLAMIGFLNVWLSAHAINVLIALCPFGFIDSLLKLFKAFLLLAITASSFISPFLGLCVSLAIVLVAIVVAPWAFRLTLFGAIFGLDVLLASRARRGVRVAEPHAFLARAVNAVPARTYGRLTRGTDGSATFAYRPWLLLPPRLVSIPGAEFSVSRGVLFPSLHHRPAGQPRPAMVLIFLPRYRSHEEAIARGFGIGEVTESPLRRGYQAVRAWFTETLSLGRKATGPA